MRLQRSLWIAFGLFSVISISYIFFHEPWRDEAQVWLLARDASLWDLIMVYAGYEGSPVLWHLLIMPFAKLGLPYITMHILHALLIISAAWVWMRYAPFTILQKILGLFGYFLLFEYNAISRSYVLTVLCLFMLATWFVRRNTDPVINALLIALLMLTNTHGLIIGIVLLAEWVCSTVKEKHYSRQCYLAWLLPLGSLCAAFVMLIPPADLAPHLSRWHVTSLTEFVPKIFSYLTYAFFPPIAPVIHFWSDRLDVVTVLTVVIGVLLVVGSCFVLQRFRTRWIFFASITGLLTLFILKPYPGIQFRHIGLIYIVFLVALWIDTTSGLRLRSRVTEVFLTILFGIQALFGVVAYIIEWQYEFVPTDGPVQYLRNSGYTSANTLLVVHPHPRFMTYLPYVADQFMTFYSLQTQAETSFVVWSDAMYGRYVLTEQEILQGIQRANQTDAHHRRILFAGNRPLKDAAVLQHLTLQAAFEEDTIVYEPIYIYEYHP